MVTRIEALFPKLRPGNYRVTSPPTALCNCIAWAAGDDRRWWWPERGVDNGYWPEEVPFAVTIEAFTAAFALLGYAPCSVEEEEPGFERIALFATADGAPTHAARQLLNGRWTSKLGKGEDIEHALHELEGDIYGGVIRMLKRPRAADAGPGPPLSEQDLPPRS
jgi:hypothetical protein